MGAIKRIPKDWRTQNAENTRGGLKTTVTYESAEIFKSEDLPELLTTKEAAVFLKRHPKTVEEYRKDGSLKFSKNRGRYFTTPGYIAQFLEDESKK